MYPGEYARHQQQEPPQGYASVGPHGNGLGMELIKPAFDVIARVVKLNITASIHRECPIALTRTSILCQGLPLLHGRSTHHRRGSALC
eukprot:1984269-Amphidinium_carterae.3